MLAAAHPDCMHHLRPTYSPIPPNYNNWSRLHIPGSVAASSQGVSRPRIRRISVTARPLSRIQCHIAWPAHTLSVFLSSPLSLCDCVYVCLSVCLCMFDRVFDLYKVLQTVLWTCIYRRCISTEFICRLFRYMMWGLQTSRKYFADHGWNTYQNSIHNGSIAKTRRWHADIGTVSTFTIQTSLVSRRPSTEVNVTATQAGWVGKLRWRRAAGNGDTAAIQLVRQRAARWQQRYIRLGIAITRVMSWLLVVRHRKRPAHVTTRPHTAPHLFGPGVKHLCISDVTVVTC